MKSITSLVLTGKFDDIFINLGKNNLTRLDSAVFEGVLLAGGRIDVFGSKYIINPLLNEL